MTVVHDLDLDVLPGQITALLGPNGAGKSSTVMAIAGHTTVKGGDIAFEGKSILAMSPADRTRLGIAIVPEGRRVFPDLTVAQNLLIGGYVRSRKEAAANEERVLALFPRLKERHSQQAATLSGGEQQMLAIGRALMTSPRLIMIDELSLGLMPAMVDLCINAVQALKRQGIGVLLVEQNTHRAIGIADRVVVLASGRVAFSG
ncbi:MAG TPA: ABC transporter ATP-binding protein, partial [Pseudolabrys sp.]|nr:ABC transporter ATP-binding protein [Pseudolabrys sp.]